MVYVAIEVYSVKDTEYRRWHLFPVMPESLTVAHRYLQTITPTLSGVFVDEFGRAPSPVTLQGTFGLWVNKFVPSAMAKHFGDTTKSRFQRTLEEITGGNESGDAQVGTLLAGSGRKFSGYQMAKWLQVLVEESHEKDKYGEPRRVKFYNFALNEVYEVALSELALTMSIQANNLWFYSLQMTVLRVIRPEKPNQDSAGLIGGEAVSAAKLLKNRLQRGLERYKKIEGRINRASRVLSRLSPSDLIEFGAEFLDSQLKMPPGTFLDVITTVSRLPATIEAVSNITYQITSRLPNDVIRDFVQAKTAVQRAAESVSSVASQWPREQGADPQTVGASVPSMVDAGPQWVSPTNRLNEIPVQDTALLDFNNLVTQSETLVSSLRLAGEIAGTPLDSAVASDAETTLSSTSSGVAISPGPLSVPGVTQSYSVVQGDSLTDLAARYLGSPELWTQIAAANADSLAEAGTGLEFGPDDDLSLLIGVPLTIPTSAIQSGVSVSRDPFVYAAPVGQGILGRDLPQQLQTRLRSDGTKDLLVLTPAETLVQGVSARLQTTLGAINDVPSFGSTVPLLIGENFGIFTEDLTAAATREALLKDGRIADVATVEVSRSSTGIIVDFDAQLVDGTTLGVTDVSVTYDME